MIATGNVVLDVNKVPRVEMNTLCRAINKAMEHFFEDPANLAEFEAWHASYLAGKEGVGENVRSSSVFGDCDRCSDDYMDCGSVCAAGG